MAVNTRRDLKARCKPMRLIGCLLTIMFLVGCQSRVEQLVQDLSANEVATRRAAARTLDEPAEDLNARPAMKALIDAVSDTDDEVRRLAVFALGRLGKDAQPAVPVLVTALEDSDQRIRLATAHALVSIDPQNKACGPVLVDAVSKEDVRSMVALSPLQVKIDRAVPALISALTEIPSFTRIMAAKTLGDLGPDAKDALPQLRRMLNDRDPDIRAAVEKAIQRIEG